MYPLRLAHLYLASFIVLGVTHSLAAQRWSEMDYGPFLTSTLEVGRDNIANKSVSIRLDEGAGGVSEGGAFVSFDTDTLRYAAGWTGRGFMDWHNVVFDGAHNSHPALVGKRVFLNPRRPGWGRPQDGSFDDLRIRGSDGLAYGPLDRKWGHWSGLYRYGNRVVLSYSVGSTNVLDTPGLEQADGRPCLTRTVQLGPRDTDLILQVAQLPGCQPQLRPVTLPAGATLRVGVLAREPAKDGPARDGPAKVGQREFHSFSGDDHFTIVHGEELDLTNKDFTIIATIRTTENGTIFSKSAPVGPWVRNGKTFFVRNGRLVYDIGWVGTIQSRKRVNDGKWHSVAATFQSTSGVLRLYVDGVIQGERPLRPKTSVDGQVIRIGYTASDFPTPRSAFIGDIRDVRLYQRRLTNDELRASGHVDEKQLRASWELGRAHGGEMPDASGRGHDAKLTRNNAAGVSDGLAVACVGVADPDWRIAPDGSLQLRIPSGTRPLRFKLLFAALDRDQDLAALATAVAQSPSPADLPELTRGGPPLWRDAKGSDLLETKTTPLGDQNGPFVVETLTIPQQNPWHSWMRLGGFDFFADGDRAALCSWQGDVWIVQGLASPSGTLRWQRIASGLFQPLGLKIVDEEIYVLGRDQITRLHDLNGDGEADFYENFNNDAQVTDHFHEFAMDLQTDQHGNFYYMKAARHALPAVVPQHGTLMQVSRDGRQATVLARGFRAPDGLLVNDDGTFLTIDQEGHWTPMNRVNWIKPGRFYGNMMAANPANIGVDDTDEPVCWIHRDTDRSPTSLVRVPRDRWGPLSGALLTLSYGTGKTFRLLHEQVGDRRQGGIVQLPIAEFPTGIQRGRFHPRDGKLYVCGLFGWSSDKTLAGGFYRIRYTGKPVAVPEGLSATVRGVLLRFPMPLDREAAATVSNFRVSRWNYRRTANYGSDDYRVSDGKPGRDQVAVSSVSISRDQRSLFLHIDDMTPCMQMRVRYHLRAADGAPIVSVISHTVHVLKELDADLRNGFEDRLVPPVMADTKTRRNKELATQPGLVLRISTLAEGASPDDVSIVRTAALRCQAGHRPTLFSKPGPFVAQWDGMIDSDLPETAAFQARGQGTLTVWVNDRVLLRTETNSDFDISTEPLRLRSGHNSLRVRLVSREDGAAALRLLWKRGNQVQELLRPERLSHDPFSAPELPGYQQLRLGRELVARYHCARCHDAREFVGGMPEMNVDLPSLAGVADRLTQDWLGRWISDPSTLRNDISMAHVLSASREQEIVDIVAYLESLRSTEQATLSNAVKTESDSTLVERGLNLYEDIGCIACHHMESVDFEDPYQRITLRYVGAKFRAGKLVQFLRQPHAFYAARRMPDFQMSLDEARALAAYLRDQSKTIEPMGDASGDARRGKRAFEERGCAACHAVSAPGVLPEPTEQPLFELSDRSRGCLARDDSQRGEAPQFDLEQQQREALNAFLRAGGESLAREVPAEAAERLLRRLHCTACHVRDLQRATFPEILAEEGEQGHPAESLPPLTWTGEKLQTTWLRTMLAGKLEYRARPWKRGRMAAFPAYAQTLAHGLAAQHGVTLEPREAASPDSKRARIGRRLTEKDQGFNCLQCHGLPGKPPEAPFESRGIDFQLVHDRIRPDFYHRWIGNPVQFDVSVPMPRFSPDGKTTPVKTILDGIAEQQFDAIWEYLRTVND